MKILIISHEYPPIGGGGANACMNLSKEYAIAGSEVYIVTVWYEGLQEYEVITEYEAPIHITRLKAKRNNKEHCSFVEMMDFVTKATKQANDMVKKAMLNEKSYDVCQVFFGIPSGPVGYILKKKYGLPYIIRFGGGDIPGFQDRFSFIYKLLRPAVRLIWKNADSLVANSEGLKQLALDFCDKYPIKIFPNGVDTDTFYPAYDKPFSDNKVELLFISRLIERKGLQFILPGLNELEKKSGKRIHLTIVGDGPFREELERMVIDNDVADLVAFEGQKDKNELLKYYHEGDVFVFPSKKEGMPNAVLEAMACGLPIVMSPCQGSSELINGNGVIANMDLTKFNESIVSIISESCDNLRSMSKCSRKRAEKYFSWKSVANDYLELFNDLMV